MSKIKLVEKSKERVEFKQFGWAILGKKVSDKAQDVPYAPLKIYPSTDDGKMPDYGADSIFIKRTDLQALFDGREYKIPALISPPLPKKS